MVARRVHPAHGPGGLERHVFELVSHLAEQVDIDLFSETPATTAKRALAERAFPTGVRAHWISGHWLPLGTRRGTVVLDRITNYPWWSRRVARHMLTDAQTQGGSSWSVVHVHGLAGLGLARAAGRGSVAAPLVVTTQGLEEFQSHIRLKRWLYAPFRAGMRTVAARSDVVVTTDASLGPPVERYLGVPEADQVVIPNAVDPEKCHGLSDRSRGCELLEQLGLNDAAPVFLSVGRLEANKGFAVLVSALAKVAARLPPSWGWVLVGDGPERENVQRALTHAGLSPHAVLAGRVEDRDLHSLYTVADWFVHPTLYEGSSLVTLEAMAHGLPVIASRVGGLPDKVQDGVTGFLVPPGDDAALAQRLTQTAEVDGERFGQAGRRLCDARFSWAVVAPQYVALYRTLATPTRP